MTPNRRLAEALARRFNPHAADALEGAFDMMAQLFLDLDESGEVVESLARYLETGDREHWDHVMNIFADIGEDVEARSGLEEVAKDIN